jgi:hypothetical protein
VETARDIGKFLILVGFLLCLLGGIFVFGEPWRLPLSLGRLPGDIAIRGKNGTFYFPLATCVLLSVALTLILWIVNHFRR